MPPSRTVWLSQPIHPTPAAERGLHQQHARILAAQRALNTTLQLRAAGHDVRLLDVALADDPRGLPRLPAPGTHVSVPPVTLDALLAEFRPVRDALGWARHVPASAYHHAVSETARAWRALGHGPVPLHTLPEAWDASRPVELHLDSAVQLVDDVTLEIASLGPHALVLADLVLLPSPYRQALVHRQQRRLAHEAGRLQRLDRAWLDGGDADAAAQALRLRARYAAAGLALDGQVPPPERSKESPRCLDRAVIREVTSDDGLRGWEVRWAFRVDAPTRWCHDDCLGLDPGGRHVVAYAADGLRGVILRPLRGPWAPPQLPPSPGLLQVPLDEARARALHRRALMLRMLPAYDDLLSLALQFRIVALEDLSWASLRRRGSRYPEYAREVGLLQALRWIRELAPAHGVEVRLTPARHSSRTCPECLTVGSRPWKGGPFSCRHCGYHEALGDVAAARVHRHRALNGEWRHG